MRRLDFKNTHGYQGTVRKNGIEKTKFFSDTICGGKNSALKYAREWEWINGKIERVRKVRQRKPIKQSNVGVLGLHLRKKKQRNGNISNVLQVHWSEGGKRYYAERSIDLHTYEGAMRELEALRNRNHRPIKVK